MTSEEHVYVAIRTSGSHGDRYHTDSECQAIRGARNVVEKPLDLLRKGTVKCTFCAGDHPGGPRKDPHRLRRKLLDLSPDDVGLSPAIEPPSAEHATARDRR